MKTHNHLKPIRFASRGLKLVRLGYSPQHGTSTMKKLSLIFFLLASPCFGQGWSSFLDPSRAIDWSSTRTGFTIPNLTTPCATQPTLTANSASAAAANATAIQNALASCDASHNVVSIPAGTYYVAGIAFGGQGYQVLRGAGPNSTRLIMTASAGCSGEPAGICMMPSVWVYAGNSTVLPPSGTRQCLWTAGYVKGTTSITLNSCPGGAPPVNQQLILDQSNDLADTGGLYLCDSYTSSQTGGGVCTANDGSATNADGRRINGYTYSQKQIVMVQSVSGSGTGPFTVTISPGVYFNNIRSSQSPGAWWPGTVVNEGLENLYVDGSALASDNIQIVACYECWVKNVSSYNAARAHVMTDLSSHSVIRDSYFFQSQTHSEESYGVEFESTSADLIENNICQQLTNCIMVGNTSGSVIGYNFNVGTVYVNTNYLISSFSSHNAGNDMILYEGNNFLSFNTDDTWGSANTETYFRNFLSGWQHQSSGPVYGTQPFIDRSFSRANNVVGNVLGQPGYHNTYQSYSTSSSGGVNQNVLSTSVYSLGWTGITENTAGTCSLGTTSSGCDPVVFNTLMRWGNYDVVNAAAQWNSTTASPAAVSYVNANFSSSYFSSLAHTLPASLYYSSAPSWWPSGKNWPPVGPDVTTGNVGTCSGGSYPGAQATASGQCTSGTLNSPSSTSTAWASHVVSIPAQDCYLSVLGGPPDGTGGILPFDANTCYNQSGVTNVAPPTGLTAIVN
jgi:hypothetical protein